MPTPRTRTYQHSLTGEVREILPEDFDWYTNNPPWCRVESVTAPEAFPPSERAAKAAKPKA